MEKWCGLNRFGKGIYSLSSLGFGWDLDEDTYIPMNRVQRAHALDYMDFFRTILPRKTSSNLQIH